MKRVIQFVILGSLWLSCVGTDVIDDPIVEPSLVVDQELFTLLVGQTGQLTYSYENKYGFDDGTSPQWIVQNPAIVSVNMDGEITALTAGQTIIKGVIENVESDEVLVNVVDDETSIVKVLIEEPSTKQINVGESLQLNSTGWNINDEQTVGTTFQWEVDKPSIASIDNTGLLVGLSNGLVKVTAIIDGIKSVPLEIEVGTEVKMGTFMSAGSYSAEGMATLQRDSDGDVILTLSDDFMTSFALGTFIYMSNSTSGSDTKGAGLELGEIKNNGAHSFNISTIKPNVDLDTYQYVIVLCKPAAITFGFAELN